MDQPSDDAWVTVPIGFGDVEEVHAIQTDERTWVHSPSQRPHDVADTLGMIERSISSWKTHGQGLWVVREQGRVIGVAGATMSELGVWNLYYRFAPDSGGRGIASNVASLATDGAHASVPQSPVVARILANNARSIRVAERAGLSEQWRGAVGREADRLILADRPLAQDLVDLLAALG